MQTISETTVERTWKKMAQLADAEMQQVVERMEKEQPEIMAFLMAADYDTFNQDERELVFYLGMVVWEMMRQGTPRPQQVSEERLYQLVERTDQMVESLMGESEGDFVAVATQVFKNHNQLNVLRYIVEALFEMEEDDEDTEIRDDMKGLIFLNLKTMVEALDQ
ncbi:MAG: hypothetical protein ALAOOOJD_02108 [bacterium]|nr:hypothetical protein [bacterium]